MLLDEGAIEEGVVRNLLAWPRCGGTMRIIAVIEPACADTCLRRSRNRQAADRRPAIVRQILTHLRLWAASTHAPARACGLA